MDTVCVATNCKDPASFWPLLAGDKPFGSRYTPVMSAGRGEGWFCHPHASKICVGLNETELTARRACTYAEYMGYMAVKAATKKSAQKKKAAK